MDEKLLEIRLNEAISIKRLVADDVVKDDMPAGRRLSLKLIDAILTMEDEQRDEFPLWVDEPQLWLLNSLVFEESKDMFGASLRPFLRNVWRLLREYHQHELLHVPDVALEAEQLDDGINTRFAAWRSSASKDGGLSEIGG